MYTIATNEIAIRLVAAALLGGIIGWERERKDGAAGLRTHMLVCVGSSLVMIVSAYGFQDILGRPNVVLDPSRIAAQVISGIGFLGAGTIFFLRPQVVRGLTTAAGLWSVAAIGLAAGGGLYIAAIIATVIIFIVLGVIKPIERTIKNVRAKTLTLLYDSQKVNYTTIENVLKENNIIIAEVLMHSMKNESLNQMKITLGDNSDNNSVITVINELNILDGVQEITSRI